MDKNSAAVLPATIMQTTNRDAGKAGMASSARSTGRLALAGLVALLASACGGGGSDPVPVVPAVLVTAQPSAASAVSGSSATFSVSATGSGLSYQWQRSIDSGVNWADIVGANAASYLLAVVNALMNGYQYRALVSAAGTTVSTTPVTLSVAAAPLQARLAGAAYYSPDLDVTLLANANLPVSLPLGITGIASDGTMTWATAKAWIQALNASNHLGHNDWRLPAVTPINATAFVFNNDPADPFPGYSGQMDLGYNISAPGTRFGGSQASELPYLFYNTLKNVAAFDIRKVAQSTAANSKLPLSNVAAAPYWTSYQYGTTGAIAFNMGDGSQFAYGASTAANPGAGFRFNVMVFRSGDL